MKVIEIQSVLAKSNDILKSGFKNGNTVTAERYGSLAWYQLFVKTYTDAEQSAVHGLELDPTQTWIKTNLAHALLFQNKNSDAKKVYDELKNQKNTEGVSYQDLLTQDFNILEQAGLDKTQLDKARQWIKD